jgi:hypothetical protein
MCVIECVLLVSYVCGLVLYGFELLSVIYILCTVLFVYYK